MHEMKHVILEKVSFNFQEKRVPCAFFGFSAHEILDANIITTKNVSARCSSKKNYLNEKLIEETQTVVFKDRVLI